MEQIRAFLNEYNERQSTSDEIINPKIVGNYNLEIEDVYNQIIDWILHYLENGECPYYLAIEVAKNTAQQLLANMFETGEENRNKRKMLNSINLYTEAIKKVPLVCSSLSERINEMKTCSSSGSSSLCTSVIAIKNKRRKMEDRHVIHHDLNALLDLKDMPPHCYFAVFDGHSGVDAASYASAHLHANMAKHPAFLTDTETAITEAFKITDENFLHKCAAENLKSGSTAVCALIREKTLYLSWLGDSQAVLIKGGKPVLVTEPHRPERKDERERIEAAGGMVSSETGIPRVNGILAVTRALGDPDHKRFIIGVPETTTVPLDGDEDFLILACDGLWDGVSPEDAASLLYQKVSENCDEEPSESAAAYLTHQSKIQGSEDNITTVVVFLRDVAAVREYANTMAPQANFHEMNGKSPAHNLKLEFSNDMLLNSKKLKNAVNVLSSTGIADPAVVYSFSDGIIDGSTFQNVAIGGNACHASEGGLAPEATALSELPTPPIDDVMASQHFERLSALNMDAAAFETGNRSGLTEEFDKLALGSDSGKEEIPTDEVFNRLTPEEAVDIASCVVSDTIEAAVKRVSEADASPSPPAFLPSAQKLNPFAAPFIPDGFQFQTGSESATVSSCVDSNTPAGDREEIALSSGSNIAAPESVETPASNAVANVDSKTENSPQEMAEATHSHTVDILSSVDANDGSQPGVFQNKEMPLDAVDNITQSAPCSNLQETIVKDEMSKEFLAQSVGEVFELERPCTSPKLIETSDISSTEKNAICNDSEKDFVQNNVGILENAESRISEVCPKDGSVKVELITQTNSTLVLEDIIGQSVDTNSSEAVPPPDDCPVSLHKIPDGIPEAEGVTEDVDSDSEKDGGWSYMKGASPATEKSKADAKKASSKVNSLLKTKKDVVKTSIEKSKLKPSVAVEKKAAEKKIPDAKDRIKTRVVPSTLSKPATEKTAKPLSTISRINKKELPSVGNKVPSQPASRAPRSAPVKSTTTATKPIGGESNQTGTMKPAASARPKSTLTSNGPVRPAVRPTTLSARPARAPPSANQSDRPSSTATRSATLGRVAAASTLPGKTSGVKAAPTSTLSKPKPAVSTVRRAVPPASKKPDVKETKEMANKEMSARQNAAVKSVDKGKVGNSVQGEGIKKPPTLTKTAATRSASIPNRIAPLSNKFAPTKAHSTPLRTDAGKKEVSKTPASRLASKTATPSRLGSIKKKAPAQVQQSEAEIKKVEKAKENEIYPAAENEKNKSEVTPEEAEKFAQDVKDKEKVKEQEEPSPSSQEHPSPEGGMSEIPQDTPLPTTVATQIL